MALSAAHHVAIACGHFRSFTNSIYGLAMLATTQPWWRPFWALCCALPLLAHARACHYGSFNVSSSFAVQSGTTAKQLQPAVAECLGSNVCELGVSSCQAPDAARTGTQNVQAGVNCTLVSYAVRATNLVAAEALQKSFVTSTFAANIAACLTSAGLNSSVAQASLAGTVQSGRAGRMSAWKVHNKMGIVYNKIPPGWACRGRRDSGAARRSRLEHQPIRQQLWGVQHQLRERGAGACGRLLCCAGLCG